MALLFAFSINGCLPTLKNQVSQIKTIRNYSVIKGDKGVNLLIETEYKTSEQGNINKGGKVCYTAKNMGILPYEGKYQDKNKIVFEFTTTNDKFIQTSETFYTRLQPKETSKPLVISPNVVADCISVKAVRME